MVQQQLKHSEITRSLKSYPITIVCDHIQDPQNIGALFRLADAAGLKKLIFITDNDELNFTKIDKISRSTRSFVPHVFCSASRVREHLDPDNHFLSLEWTNLSIPYKEWIPKKAITLFLGNEKHGVSEQWLNFSDAVVHIPMHGQNSSMNVAMAAGIVIYNWISLL